MSLWDRFNALQSELVSLHRRIEAIDTNLGILIAAGVAFVLYGMEHHHQWRRSGWENQTWPMVVIGLAIILSLYTLVILGDDDRDWLLVEDFEQKLKVEGEEKALDEALELATAAYRDGRLSERNKSGFQKLSVALLTLGAIFYVCIGYQVATIAVWVLGIAAVLYFVLRWVRAAFQIGRKARVHARLETK